MLYSVITVRACIGIANLFLHIRAARSRMEGEDCPLFIATKILFEISFWLDHL